MFINIDKCSVECYNSVVMKELKFAIDSYNFKNIIENNSFYIDKTLFIKELVEDNTGILLFPRPRRFGKSLNFSMLKYFFSIKEKSQNLFKGLKIEKYKEILKHMNQYPVVSLNFKGMDELSWEDARREIIDRIATLYKEHGEDLYEVLDENDLQIYKNIEQQQAEDIHIRKSLLKLTQHLEKKYNKKAVLLIDEYDAVMTKMFLKTKEEFDKCMNLFRGMYENAFKGNDSIYKGLLTGIMRVAKEGMFSGLNNVDVCGVNIERYSRHFGFLEEEIKTIVEEQELNFTNAKEWYNGYTFGKSIVYNPWSISNYLKKRILEPYWKNTSGNELLKELIKRGGPEIKYSLEEMLLGNSIELEIEDNVNLRNLDIEDVYGILLQAGYLTYEDENREKYKLPNKEVKKIIKSFLKKINDNIALTKIEQLINLSNWRELDKELKRYIFNSLSYYDPPEMGVYREKFYHALLLGMFVHLNEWKVESNREKGLGRPDIVLTKDKREIVIELKAGEKGTDNLEGLIESAEFQINNRKYGEEAEKVAMAFIGKEFAMKTF